MNAPTDPMHTMLAEWRIRDVIGRYARSVDRRDGALIAKCFHRDALMHYGDFDGSVDAFVPWVLDYLTTYSRTMHFMGASIVDWPDAGPGDQAIVETYAAVLHEKASDKPGRSWVGGIRYLDRFENRVRAAGSDAQWRIAERTVVGDWLRIDPTENHRRFGKDMLIGKAGPDDPVLELMSRTFE